MFLKNICFNISLSEFQILDQFFMIFQLGLKTKSGHKFSHLIYFFSIFFCALFASYDGKTLLDTLEVYDPKQGTWKNMSKNMAISRCDAGVTVIRPV